MPPCPKKRHVDSNLYNPVFPRFSKSEINDLEHLSQTPLLQIEYLRKYISNNGDKNNIDIDIVIEELLIEISKFGHFPIIKILKENDEYHLQNIKELLTSKILFLKDGTKVPFYIIIENDRPDLLTKVSAKDWVKKVEGITTFLHECPLELALTYDSYSHSLPQFSDREGASILKELKKLKEKKGGLFLDESGWRKLENYIKRGEKFQKLKGENKIEIKLES